MTRVRRIAREPLGLAGLLLLLYVVCLSGAYLAGVNFDDSRSAPVAIVNASRFPALVLGLLLTYAVRFELRAPHWAAGAVALAAVSIMATQQAARQLHHNGLADALSGFTNWAFFVIVAAALVPAIRPAKRNF